MKMHPDNVNENTANANLVNSKNDQVENNTDFGVLLADARKMRNCTIDEVSAYLKIPVKTITALETSDKDKLPVATFTQGYIRAYAKFLEISEQEVLAVYNNAVSRDDVSELKPRSTLPDEANSQSPLIKAITVFLIVAVIAVIVFGGIQYYQNKADVLGNQLDAKKQNFTGNSLDSPGSQPLAIKQNTGLINGERDVATAENKKTKEPSTAVDASSASIVEGSVRQKATGIDNNIRTAPSENRADAVKKADTIEIFAENGAWLEVRDANKSRLHYNMLPVGGHALLVGRAPFSVIVGNASSTRVEVNGVTIDVGDYTRSNNTANFKVSTQGQDVLFQ